MGITTRRDAVAQLGGMNLAHEEVEDAIDAVRGTGAYAGRDQLAATGWDGRWESLDDATTYDRVSRAVWAHATDGAAYPF